MFHRVSERIAAIVGELRPARFSDDLRVLRRLFDLETPVPISYDEVGHSFARAYALINYWKVAAALLRERPDFPCEIVDLGCGAGSAAASALAASWAADESMSAANVHLVDYSQGQIELANRVLDAVSRVRPGGVRITAHLCDIDHFHLPPGPRRLVLLSHLLTENPHTSRRILDQAASMAGRRGAIVVVEREHDPIWTDVARWADEEMYTCVQSAEALAPARLHLPEWSANLDRERLPLRYALIETPESPQLQALVRAYFSAWRHRSLQELDQVFSSDATYQPSPFDDPLRGIDAIRRYWEREVLTQEMPTVFAQPITFAERCAVVDWRATFTRSAVRYDVRGMMALTANPSVCRLQSLKECYRSHKQNGCD